MGQKKEYPACKSIVPKYIWYLICFNKTPKPNAISRDISQWYQKQIFTNGFKVENQTF